MQLGKKLEVDYRVFQLEEATHDVDESEVKNLLRSFFAGVGEVVEVKVSQIEETVAKVVGRSLEVEENSVKGLTNVFENHV